jgi:glycoside/pentoside/hexuronide:cation symporter, GPH family
MNNQEIKTSGISFKDKVGYALGDTAGVLTFGIIGAFLQMFYTDVLYIDLNKIIVLMLVARIWDAVNDPLWGAFIDARKPKKLGKFRPYILWLSIPLAIAAVLTFTKIPGLSENQYLIYAYITYIFYGMMYTGTNIPYGSLASVITDDEIERADLSVFRSIGAGIGGLPGQILLPLFVFSTVADTGAKYLDSTKLTFSVAVLAGFSVIVYYFSFRMTKERVTSPIVPQKSNIILTIKVLVKNRAFILLCLASMLLIASQIYSQTVFNYLFKDYFGNPKLFSLYTLATYGPMILLIPFMGKLVKRFGKKEICAAGMALSAVTNILLWLLKIQNPYVFLSFCFVSGIGTTFFILEVWALVTDVIDYQEYLSKRREEGTSYAFFSFTRKLGQTFAGIIGVYVLKLISYDAKNITPEVVSKMYTVSTLVPAILFASMFVVLGIFYPLNKAKLKQLHENEYKQS